MTTKPHTIATSVAKKTKLINLEKSPQFLFINLLFYLIIRPNLTRYNLVEILFFLNELDSHKASVKVDLNIL
jgi:hypothetical protein